MIILLLIGLTTNSYAQDREDLSKTEFFTEDLSETLQADISVAILPPINYIEPSTIPVAQFTANTTKGCVNAPVQFNDESTNEPATWSWDFGDGRTSSLQNPTHTYTKDGMYTVTLTAANISGSNFQTKPDYITVNKLPVVTLSVSVRRLMASSSSKGKYQWYKYNVLIAGATGDTYFAAENGIYKAVLTNANGCVGESNEVNVVSTAVIDPVLDISLAIKPMINYDERPRIPEADFTAKETMACIKAPVRFNDESINEPTTWWWDFGDGGTSTIQNPTHTYTKDGMYTVTLTAANMAGWDFETKAGYITVNKLPVVTLLESERRLMASSSSKGTYQWYKDNVLIAGATGDTYFAAENGIYKAVLTNTNDCVGESNAINVVLTAVIDPVLDASIEIYPNPVSEILYVKIIGAVYNGLQLAIFDLSGKEITNILVNNPMVNIDMRNFSSGIYLLKAETDNGRMTIKKVIH